MTLDALIAHLEWVRLEVGGLCEVKVVGVGGAPKIRVQAEDTPDGGVVWIKAERAPVEAAQ